jgi:hypothetical protein
MPQRMQWRGSLQPDFQQQAPMFLGTNSDPGTAPDASGSCCCACWWYFQHRSLIVYPFRDTLRLCVCVRVGVRVWAPRPAATAHRSSAAIR